MARIAATLILAIGGAAAGCLGLGSGTPPPRSYVLLAAAQTPATAPDLGSLRSVGVGPVGLPRFLDRPQIVTVGPGNEVILTELDRWAEPLADGIARALAANFAALLPGVRVERHPWSPQVAPDLEVRVDVLRLEGSPGGKCALEARWALLRGNKLTPGVSKFEAAAGTEGHGGLVASWSQLLARAAEEMAAAIAQHRE